MNERLTLSITDFNQDQAEAIAIGIAYGFFIPKFTTDSSALPSFPMENIQFRLAYPVSIAHNLPMRRGENLRVPTLRQLEFSLWKD